MDFFLIDMIFSIYALSRLVLNRHTATDSSFMERGRALNKSQPMIFQTCGEKFTYSL